MTREAALSRLRILGRGLSPDYGGVARFAERIAADDEAETLRALLVEVGARSLLDEMMSDRADRLRVAVEKHRARTGA